MDTDRIKGKAQQFKGAAKEAAGTVTGNPSLKREGKIDKASGKIQEGFGKAKDDLRAHEKERPHGRPD